MKAIFVAFFVTWSATAFCAPGDEARHTAGVIEGCRLVAQGKVGQSRLDGMQWGVCLGALQALRIISRHLQPNMRSCVPSDASTEQVAKVFLKYADQNPERHNDGIEILAVEAFKAGWPCKAK